MKFKLPKKLRESFNEMIKEQGGIGNLPDVGDWIDQPTERLINEGEIQLGWAEQEDTNNIELVKFTNIREHEMFPGQSLPDNVLLIRCENRNDEFGDILIGPGENGFDVAMLKLQDNDFMDRVMFHTQEMGFLDSLVTYLFNKS